MPSTFRSRLTNVIAPAAAGAALALAAGPAFAQDGAAAPSGDYLNGLKACQQIADDAQRLACFDRAVGTIVTAEATGDLQVIDREAVRQTRRSLFGFRLPSLGIFGNGEDEQDDELFSTTIESVRYLSGRAARITTAEGAVWEMNDIPANRRRFEAGDPIVFKPASFGFYFLRIDGQNGVKGRRVQ